MLSRLLGIRTKTEHKPEPKPLSEANAKQANINSQIQFLTQDIVSSKKIIDNFERRPKHVKKPTQKQMQFYISKIQESKEKLSKLVPINTNKPRRNLIRAKTELESIAARVGHTQLKPDPKNVEDLYTKYITAKQAYTGPYKFKFKKNTINKLKNLYGLSNNVTHWVNLLPEDEKIYKRLGSALPTQSENKSQPPNRTQYVSRNMPRKSRNSNISQKSLRRNSMNNTIFSQSVPNNSKRKNVNLYKLGLRVSARRSPIRSTLRYNVANNLPNNTGLEAAQNSLQKNGLGAAQNSLQKNGLEAAQNSLQKNGLGAAQNSLQKNRLDAAQNSLQKNGLGAAQNSLQKNRLDAAVRNLPNSNPTRRVRRITNPSHYKPSNRQIRRTLKIFEIPKSRRNRLFAPNHLREEFVASKSNLETAKQQLNSGIGSYIENKEKYLVASIQHLLLEKKYIESGGNAANEDFAVFTDPTQLKLQHIPPVNNRRLSMNRPPVNGNRKSLKHSVISNRRNISMNRNPKYLFGNASNWFSNPKNSPEDKLAKARAKELVNAALAEKNKRNAAAANRARNIAAASAKASLN